MDLILYDQEKESIERAEYCLGCSLPVRRCAENLYTIAKMYLVPREAHRFGCRWNATECVPYDFGKLGSTKSVLFGYRFG